jgi:hypothetical protein
MRAPPNFRRLVLALGHGEAGSSTLRGAAEAARLLQLALHCVLIEDEALTQLPALPFARELRLPTHDWRPMDPTRLVEELAATEWALRRDLERLAARLGIAQALEVQRGDPQICLGGLCVAGDIVVLEADPSARPRPHRAALLHEAALRSAAAVLLLPAAAPPPAATVAALLAGADDPALDIAARIAAGSGAGLLAVVAEGDAGEVALRAARLGVDPGRLAIRHAGGGSLASVAALLGAGRERLLVLDHAGWTDRALAEALASGRGVPVLLL